MITSDVYNINNSVQVLIRRSFLVRVCICQCWCPLLKLPRFTQLYHAFYSFVSLCSLANAVCFVFIPSFTLLKYPSSCATRTFLLPLGKQDRNRRISFFIFFWLYLGKFPLLILLVVFIFKITQSMAEDKELFGVPSRTYSFVLFLTKTKTILCVQ